MRTNGGEAAPDSRWPLARYRALAFLIPGLLFPVDAAMAAEPVSLDAQTLLTLGINLGIIAFAVGTAIACTRATKRARKQEANAASEAERYRFSESTLETVLAAEPQGRWFAGDPHYVPGSFQRKLWSLCALVVLLLTCAVLTWIGAQAFLAVPSADDFCYGFRAREEGVFQAILDEYVRWGGRYTSTFLMGLFFSSKKFITEYYFLGPILILAANFFASMYILTILNMRSVWFLIIFFTILVSAYSLRETIFWTTGGITYGLGSALFISIIGAELSLISHQSRPTTRKVATISFASLILAGFNETIMVAHVTLLFCLFILCTIFDKKLYRPVGIVLSAAIFGAAVVALAPGNSNRASNFLEPQFFLSIAHSFTWLINQYASFFVLTTLLLLCTIILFIEKPQNKKTNLSIPPILVFVSFFFTLWASAFTRFYSLGRGGPERSYTVDYAILTVLCLLIAWYLYKKIAWYPYKNVANYNSHRLLYPVSVVLLACGFAVILFLRPVLNSFSQTTALDNIRQAFQLNRSMSNRFKILKGGKGECVWVAALENIDRRTTITLFADIEIDPKHWKNTCYARYFNLKQVSLRAKDIFSRRRDRRHRRRLRRSKRD